MLPMDAEEFLEWFIYVERPFLTPAEMMRNWPEITVADFRKFAEYKEFLFHNGGKFGDLPIDINAEPKVKKGKTAKQDQLAVFYRCLQETGHYHHYGQDGRTAQEDYKVIAERHGISHNRFKNKQKGVRLIKSIEALIDELGFELVETLVATLPADGKNAKLVDILRIEKAKTKEPLL